MKVRRTLSSLNEEIRKVLLKLIKKQVDEILDVFPELRRDDLELAYGKGLRYALWVVLDDEDISRDRITSVLPRDVSDILADDLVLSILEFINSEDVQTGLDEYRHEMDLLLTEYGSTDLDGPGRGLRKGSFTTDPSPVLSAAQREVIRGMKDTPRYGEVFSKYKKDNDD